MICHKKLQTETVAALTNTNNYSITEKKAVSNLLDGYFTNVSLSIFKTWPKHHQCLKPLM